MAGTVIFLPSGSSLFWGDAVANFAALPAVGRVTGEVVLALDTGIPWYWTGAAWAVIPATLVAGSISDTDSIDHTVTLGVLSSVLKISADAATAGFYKSTATIKSGASPGLHVETELAATAQTGILTSTDWNTFNNKEPAITSGTTAQYWRGDKSFQTLNSAALAAIVSGAAQSAGKVGEILTAEQATSTVTGVGATGVYGNAISLSLTAGAWLVWGAAGFEENGATLTTGLVASISDSASGVGLTALDSVISNALVSSTSDAILPIHARPVNISGTTTYYINTKLFYTAGTPKHYGRIYALRIF